MRQAGNRHVPTMPSFDSFTFELTSLPVYNLGFDSIRNQKKKSLMLNCPFETKNNTLNTPMYILFLAFQFFPHIVLHQSVESPKTLQQTGTCEFPPKRTLWDIMT